MSPSEKPATGESFNPWRGACKFYPPDVVGRDRTLNLTDGAKRLFEKLVRYAGQDGHCWPSQARLADDLGKVERQTRYDLEKLRAAGLIDWHSRKAENGRGNVYVFLWHPIFERQTTAGQLGTSDDSSGKPLPVTTGNNLPVDSESCLSRPASVPFQNGKPLPGNSVQEIYTYTASEEDSSKSEERRAAAVKTSKARTPEEMKLADVLDHGGVRFRPGDPAELLRTGRELGVDADQVTRFVIDTLSEKLYRHDPVQSAAFLLKVLPEDLAGWIKRNTQPPAPKPTCGKCYSGWIPVGQYPNESMSPCPCRDAAQRMPASESECARNTNLTRAQINDRTGHRSINWVKRKVCRQPPMT